MSATSPLRGRAVRVGLLVAGALLVLIAVGRLGGLGGQSGGTDTTASTLAAAPPPSPGPDATQEPWIVQRVDLTEGPEPVVVDLEFVGGELLALVSPERDDAVPDLVLIDTATGRATQTPVPAIPGPGGFLLAADATAWLGEYRTDNDTGGETGGETGGTAPVELRLARIIGPGPGGPAAGAPGGDDYREVDLGGGAHPVVVSTGGSLWVLCCESGRGPHRIASLDPTTLEPGAPIELRRRPCDLASGGGFLWLVDGTGVVHRIDPRASRVTATVDVVASLPDGLRDPPKGACNAIEGHEGGAFVHVWSERGGVVVELDLDGSVVRADPLLGSDGSTSALDLYRVGGTLLALEAGGERLLRVDRGVVTGAITQPGSSTIVVGDGALWVATPSGEVRRVNVNRMPAPS